MNQLHCLGGDMVEALKENFKDVFFDLIKSARNCIKLCSPFVKKTIIDEIFDNKQNNTELTLITNFNLNYFYRRSSDIEAINKIIDAPYNVLNCQNLHAKIYIFDDEVSIITSSNLTYSGFNRNLEYGMKVDDRSITQTIVNDYDTIVEHHLDNSVTKNQVTLIKEILENTPKQPQDNVFSSEIEGIFHIHENEIVESLNGWTKETFIVVDNLENNIFVLSELNKFVPHFKKIYPNNNNIEAKIRQQLQLLRNLGLIKFEGQGVYKKLWN